METKAIGVNACPHFISFEQKNNRKKRMVTGGKNSKNITEIPIFTVYEECKVCGVL